MAAIDISSADCGMQLEELQLLVPGPLTSLQSLQLSRSHPPETAWATTSVTTLVWDQCTAEEVDLQQLSSLHRLQQLQVTDYAGEDLAVALDATALPATLTKLAFVKCGLERLPHLSDPTWQRLSYPDLKMNRCEVSVVSQYRHAVRIVEDMLDCCAQQCTQQHGVNLSRGCVAMAQVHHFSPGDRLLTRCTVLDLRWGITLAIQTWMLHTMPEMCAKL